MNRSKTVGMPSVLTPTGIRAAKAAGMQAIGFAAMTPAAQLHAAGADVVVHTMAEVQALLAAL